MSNIIGDIRVLKSAPIRRRQFIYNFFCDWRGFKISVNRTILNGLQYRKGLFYSTLHDLHFKGNLKINNSNNSNNNNNIKKKEN